jgi:FkbH-like protein
MRHLRNECSFVVGASYEDKFGPLGVIGVMTGHQAGDQVEVTSWVLSCRAFSRKIEHHMLEFVFRQLNPASVRLAFRSTGRNQPLREFLKSIGLEEEGDGEMLLSREQFHSHVDELPHEVRIQENV